MTLTEKFKKDVQTLRGAANGESFIIADGAKNAVIVPYNETIKYTIESTLGDELIHIYTDHEEGS